MYTGEGSAPQLLSVVKQIMKKCSVFSPNTHCRNLLSSIKKILGHRKLDNLDSYKAFPRWL